MTVFDCIVPVAGTGISMRALTRGTIQSNKSLPTIHALHLRQHWTRFPLVGSAQVKQTTLLQSICRVSNLNPTAGAAHTLITKKSFGSSVSLCQLAPQLLLLLNDLLLLVGHRLLQLLHKRPDVMEQRRGAVPYVGVYAAQHCYGSQAGVVDRC